MSGDNGWLTVETAEDVLRLDAHSGQLRSLRRKGVPEQEFIGAAEETPLFLVQYLDDARRWRQLSSRQAERVAVEAAGDTLTLRFARLGGLDLDVAVTVRGGAQARFFRWGLTLRNGTGLMITGVQCPVVVAPYDLGGAKGSEAVLWPLGPGVLLRAPKPQDLAADYPRTWHLRPENGDASHYPGYTVAQFLAYYNDRAGLYLACEDAAGYIKQFKPVHRAPGLRLGVDHVGDWPTQGERTLEYETVLGTFTGDWYAAAQLYRDWSLQQPWAATPLVERRDVPGWLLDSPPHLILRIQGELDFGPAEPNEAFLPYPKAIPLLEPLAERLGAPLVPVIMSWERPGPWIYPDCFPPVGGDESLCEFTAQARARGWHVGTFCNGTRWVTGHYWSGYEGEDYFEAQDGARSVCRTAQGELWKEKWDETWRPSYAGCLGAPETRELALAFVRRVLGDGLDWVQFLDQNVGCATFPCYSDAHAHPPAPGRWMTAAMRALVEGFHAEAHAAAEQSAGERQVIFSVEGPVNEVFMPDFQICDIRVVPPGHTAAWAPGFVPLYHFLYHEFILIQGGFGGGPEPYHLPIRNAYNWVIGEIPGAVLKGDGTLLNLDTVNWAPWDIEVGSQEDALRMLQAATLLRRGAARPFLVYGRMLPPVAVEGIATQRWEYERRVHEIPAVFHAAWQAPDGRLGVALANWTDAPQTVTLREPRLGHQVSTFTATHTVEVKLCYLSDDASLAVTLPPLSCTLLTTKAR